MVQIPSDPETRRFVSAVQAKMGQVAAAYEDRGRNLVELATPAVRQSIVSVSVLQRRWRSGDYTHTRKDEEALKVLSKWLVEAWHRLHGTEVPKATWIKGE